MKSKNLFRRMLVTLVTVVIFVSFGFVLTPRPAIAQTGVTSPLDELKKPFQALADTLSSKVPQIGSSENAGRFKSFLERNGVNYGSVGSFLDGIVDWFKGLLNSANSPAFIAWVIDFIKRVFFLLFELLNKLVSYL
ncbi:MAG: hypothetical protein AAB920_02730 [Patescibacteria group bacterium]